MNAEEDKRLREMDKLQEKFTEVQKSLLAPGVSSEDAIILTSENRIQREYRGQKQLFPRRRNMAPSLTETGGIWE